MAYNISLSNGEPLVTIADGTVDVNYTSLNLVGKNFSGYGQLMNENFVHLLENFSNSSEPLNPLTGQLWYDSGQKVMKVRTPYNSWKNIGSAYAGPTAPVNPIVGDQWWDTINSQLKSWNGAIWLLIGPLFSRDQGATGSIPDTIRDDTGRDHIIIKFFINNIVVAIWSKDAVFRADTASIIPGFVESNGDMIVKPGTTYANIGSYSILGIDNIPTNMLWGTAENALKLSGITANKFLRNDLTGSPQKFEDTVQFNNATALSLGGAVMVQDDSVHDIGAPSTKLRNVYATTFHGVATSAQYADLAERFKADAVYEPGTVVAIGGINEVTASMDELSDDVFGVVSTHPAYLMNATAGTDATHPPIAVSGRVPVKVKGQVRKGDRLVSAGNGFARAASKTEITPWNVIGRALANKESDSDGVVEAIVKLSS